MADQKISQLSSGAPAQAGDEYVVARSGANYKLTLTNIAGNMPATTISSGNLTFSGTGQRITGDMSNATAASRLSFQSSTTNGNTTLGVLPNGTATAAVVSVFANSDPANTSLTAMGVNSAVSESFINANRTGTGTYLPMTFYTGGSERMRIDSSGNVGIGGTASATDKVTITGTLPSSSNFSLGSVIRGTIPSTSTSGCYGFATSINTQAASFTTAAIRHFSAEQGTLGASSAVTNQYGFVASSNITGATNNYGFYSDIDSAANRWNFYAAGTARNYFAGDTGIGTTGTNPIGDNAVGTVIFGSGAIAITRDSNPPLLVNRKTNDGNLVEFYQDGVLEGSISVAGNVVSYNPFMGSHYTEIVGAMPTLKGTVLESLDELVDGKYSSQDRLPKAKISDTAGSSSVYGVYFSPDSDPDTNDGILAAALGASWVRIAAGVTVQRGDLLESNGDGCAKVQSDNIIRSKTIGKVTSTTVADTYADGSYIVPCVLYCG